jgi:hypothetical protein
MLGGPLVAGYFIAQNFRAFKEPGRAIKTWIITVIGTIILVAGVLSIPDDVNIPNILIPLIYTGIAYLLVRKFQGKNIRSHINSGGKIFGWWRTIGISLIGAVILILLILGFLYLTDTSETSTNKVRTFGAIKNELVYDSGNISAGEIDEIGEGLTEAGIFDETEQKSFFVEKNDRKFILYMYVIDNAWHEPEAIDFFDQVRNDIQRHIPDHKIVLYMCSDSDGEIKKTIE